MGKLLPVIMLIVGAGAGIGAGIVLAPAPEEEMHTDTGTQGGEDMGHAQDAHAGDGHEDMSSEGHSDDADHAKSKSDHASKPAKSSDGGGHGNDEDDANAPDFVKLNNQFVVPVVAGGQVEALVVLSLSIETAPGIRDQIYSREPKIRDAFLQVLFDHSNMGGFQGAFTRSNNLDILRNALTEVAQREFGHDVHNVLIVDIARQDV